MFPLKILAISHLFPNAEEPRYGIFVARQLEALAKQGADVTLMVPRAHRPWGLAGRSGIHSSDSALLPVEGVRCHSLPFPALPGIWFKRWAGTSIYRASRGQVDDWHARHQFDIIYATDLFVGGDAGRLLGKRLGIPVAALAIGGDVNVVPHASRATYRHWVRILKGVDATLACGDQLARDVDAITGRNSLSVYGVVNLDQFTPVEDRLTIRRGLGLPAEGPLVLYAGYLAREKGLLELIDAWEQSYDSLSPAHLVICGQGIDEAAIRERANQSPASSSIHFTGDVNPEQMPIFMQACDLFVLPSHAEGMPNVVMEAMACGAPVITTKVGGLPDALRDCDGAILIPPQDTQALADAIRSTLQAPEQLVLMREASRQKAEASFGAVANAKRILMELERTIAKR